ncbi:sensor domain-containing protein [[Mycobacterium] vasticus]|uniref:Sensor domain-containing protein n=1 Tax=[Mycobacterium] vasticus TaxID=2875777 RepID=A0ABU5YRF1_9MYCO|nr:sensor domain-containing protein [Mycolicibacter sp. MYC017]MEB3067690.1 sensor domain-containing protein [Mycolicibacter sp. MYC017]
MVGRAGATVAGAAVLVLLTSGCTTVVSGAARPAPGLAPDPVTGIAVRQVLLDDSDLSKLLGRSFRSDPSLPPRFGGVDQLPDGWDGATPADCVGTAVGGQRGVYESAGVRDVAHEFWDSSADDSAMTGLGESVVAMENAAAANALFEKFAEQWGHCDGVRVVRGEEDSGGTSGEVSAVSTGDAVLTATVRTNVDGVEGLMVTRAVAVRVNCVVDVDVFWFAGEDDDGDTPPAGDPTAADLARAMLDKVRGLTG